MTSLRLATRKSPLALLQATIVKDLLEKRGASCELVALETSGDQRLDVPLAQIGGEGIFAVEIQRALLRGEADVAVHSAKDLPSESPDGLMLACVPERADPADVLVGRSLAGLGPGATVATGSPRRRALLLERRPDLHIVELRGNMATRLEAAGRHGIDAVVAAAAALERLGSSDVASERLDESWFIPQVGQGAIALEARMNDLETLMLLEQINDEDAFACVLAERSFLRELGVGCSIPAGAHARIIDGMIEMRAVMIAIDGTNSVRGVATGNKYESIGSQLARHLRDELGGGSLPGWVGGA